MSAIAQSILHKQLQSVNSKAVLGQLLFAAAALLLPTITHKLGLNYTIAQPMHWMIIFAGLTYGAASGALVGLAVPVLSFLISGMPMPMALPLMMAELAVYGFVSGILKKQLSAFGAVAVALIAGRAVYLLLFMLLGRLNGSAVEFIAATWGPGLIAMILQISLLPVLSGFYIEAVKE